MSVLPFSTFESISWLLSHVVRTSCQRNLVLCNFIPWQYGGLTSVPEIKDILQLSRLTAVQLCTNAALVTVFLSRLAAANSSREADLATLREMLKIFPICSNMYHTPLKQILVHLCYLGPRVTSSWIISLLFFGVWIASIKFSFQIPHWAKK